MKNLKEALFSRKNLKLDCNSILITHKRYDFDETLEVEQTSDSNAIFTIYTGSKETISVHIQFTLRLYDFKEFINRLKANDKTVTFKDGISNLILCKGDSPRLPEIEITNKAHFIESFMFENEKEIDTLVNFLRDIIKHI